jgi:hypothetical protein
LDEIFFLLAIHSTIYKQILPPPPPPPRAKVVFRFLKSENSQDDAQKPQRNCTFMNSASELEVKEYTNSMSFRRSFPLHFSSELLLTKPKIAAFNTTL